MSYKLYVLTMNFWSWSNVVWRSKSARYTVIDEKRTRDYAGLGLWIRRWFKLAHTHFTPDSRKKYDFHFSFQLSMLQLGGVESMPVMLLESVDTLLRKQCEGPYGRWKFILFDFLASSLQVIPNTEVSPRLLYLDNLRFWSNLKKKKPFRSIRWDRTAEKKGFNSSNSETLHRSLSLMSRGNNDWGHQLSTKDFQRSATSVYICQSKREFLYVTLGRRGPNRSLPFLRESKHSETPIKRTPI